ncbi:RNA dependent RNA polymerase-domain-containing protein [Mycena filopes]|nr:RNA dependent RNA polymerase-domain-containing protein [Mycena filopes]
MSTSTSSTLAKRRLLRLHHDVDPSLRPEIDADRGVERPASHASHESRATRLVGDSKRFMTVGFAKTSTADDIRTWLQFASQDLDVAGEKCVPTYMFFGFTESTLKAGQVLFFREGDDFTVETLKQEFGDLNAVYEQFGYGKYAARLGLSFSSTVATICIKSDEIAIIPDIAADDGSLTTDGSGVARESTVGDVASVLNVSKDTAVLQIRWGGVKGTVALCPDELFDQLYGPDKKPAIRPSMRKYHGGPEILEVQDVSKPPRSARLNKQFIVLLLTRKIPFTIFEELLQMRLDEIDKVAMDREKALQCVEGELDAEGSGFDQDRRLGYMLLAGHDAVNEPYLATRLLRFQNQAREALRTKLQIPVKAAYYLFGVADYLGVLEEGEVYINFPMKGGPQVGRVAVMRNPAYDPDGIRVLKAVHKPELKHLTKIALVFFATSGARSEPDRMAGGDLDGDLYFVTFNPLLVPKSNPPEPLAHGISPSPQSTANPGRMNQNMTMRAAAVDTFIRMRSNITGQISNQWSDLMSATPKLANLSHCKELAPLMERALDALKSGIDLNELKDDFFSARRRITGLRASPEWRELTADWTDPLEMLADRVPSKIPEKMEYTPNPQLILRSQVSELEWDRMSLEAKDLMSLYNEELRKAIKADEKIRAEGGDREHYADTFKAAFIAEHFPGATLILLDLPKYLLKASVWYSVGYEHRKQSFAWLGARYLNYIKSGTHTPLALARQRD